MQHTCIRECICAVMRVSPPIAPGEVRAGQAGRERFRPSRAEPFRPGSTHPSLPFSSRWVSAARSQP
eukprot:10232473-Alexandrium_andersonii.AAC.1